MNIVLNSRYSGASTKVYIKDLGAKLSRDHFVKFNDWNNYDEYDLALFIESKYVKQVKNEYHDLNVGLFDPKLHRDRIEGIKSADFCVVGSEIHKNKLCAWNDEILVYKPFPDYQYEYRKNKSEHDRLILGYHGNKTHLEHMHPSMTNILENLYDDHNFEFHAIYNISKLGRWERGLPSIPVKHIQWTPSVYRNYLSHFDIGIKPDTIHSHNVFSNILQGSSLINILWNINSVYFDKKIIRLLLDRISSRPLYKLNKYDYQQRYKYTTNQGRLYPFAMCGIPVVADNLRTNADAIRHGEDGYLANSPSSWLHYLDILLSDCNKRKYMGKKLRRKFQKRYNSELEYKKFNEYINNL